MPPPPPDRKLIGKHACCSLLCHYDEAEIHQLLKGGHAQTQFWSNFEIKKYCGYFECKVKVIKI